MPEAKKQENGITDGFIRLSIGIEETDDLIAELEQGLKVISRLHVDALALV